MCQQSREIKSCWCCCTGSSICVQGLVHMVVLNLLLLVEDFPEKDLFCAKRGIAGSRLLRAVNAKGDAIYQEPGQTIRTTFAENTWLLCCTVMSVLTASRVTCG